MTCVECGAEPPDGETRQGRFHALLAAEHLGALGGAGCVLTSSTAA